MDLQALTALLSQFGLPIALAIFFVWQGKERESRMAARMDLLEDRLCSITERAIAAEQSLAGALRELGQSISARPCQSEQPWDGAERRQAPQLRPASGLFRAPAAAAAAPIATLMAARNEGTGAGA